MAYEPIDSAEIQVKQPVTRTLLTKVKNSLDFLHGTIGSLGNIDIPNGSFEIDSDSDGVPDNWTRGLYPAGSGSTETASPTHGAKAYKFVHPGGASNGGGYLDSDYVPCSPIVDLVVRFLHWASAAGMRNQVMVIWYDKAKVYLSSTTLYNSTANPASPTLFSYVTTPPAGARFFRLRLIGGFTDTNVAGSAWFDGVTFFQVDTPRALHSTAGAAVGGIGTYALLTHSSPSATVPGNTYAGSGLRYAGFCGDSETATVSYIQVSGSAPAGTWRAMGSNITGFNLDRQTTLFLRIL